MTEKRITLPDDLALIPDLEAGERVLLSGEIYTLRDAGHKRLVESIKAGKPEVTAPDGIPSTTVRTVSENCRTLKVTDFGFDD